jgi:predicted dinucleotide-binding enzyme
MKVGVLGSGDVAKVLASGFLEHGHQAKLGSRSPEKLSAWQAENPTGSTGTFAEAAAFGEAVVLAVKGTAALEALELAGAANLAGKTVMDATNPIADAPPVNGVLQFFTDINYSLMEKLQAAFPQAHLVKCFNSVGNILMINPQLAGGIRPTMFICGNNEAAKKQVSGILDQFGWEADDRGKAEAARAIEPLCMLWCIPGFVRNDWMHAFKVLRPAP